MLEGAGLVNYCHFLASSQKLGSHDVFLQKTPISFDVSVREIFLPFFCGGCLVAAPPGVHRDTQALAQLITARSITCTSWVPSQLEMFVQVSIQLPVCVCVCVCVCVFVCVCVCVAIKAPNGL